MTKDQNEGIKEQTKPLSISWDDHKELKIVKDSLKHRYELIDYLGGGGFGKVFKLKDKKLGRECALKVLNIDKLDESSDDERKKNKIRFIREAKAYAKCTDPNIAPIFDIGDEDTFPYFIMEYVKGSCLEDIIAEKSYLSFTKVLKISGGVLSALECIHQQDLIHRDIKPANIMIDKESGHSKIIDFGIAKDLTSSLTSSQKRFGSPYYMAPEQFIDSSKVTLKSDIYSFGVVLYEMLAGEVPFKGKNELEIMYGHLDKPVPNIRKKNPELPEGIEKIIFKAMAKEPEDRYKNAGEFRDAIRQIDETNKRIEKDKEVVEVKPVASIKSPTPKEEEDGEKPIKPVAKRSPLKKSKYKYLVYVSVIIVAVIAAFIFLNSAVPNWKYKNLLRVAGEYIKNGDYPKADEYLDKAKKNRGRVTDEIAILIKEKQIVEMKGDFDSLKKFLAGGGTEKEKLGKCREFLSKHQNTTGNKDTQAMRDETDRFISELNTDIKVGEHYQKFINDVNNLIKNGEYEKAEKELDKARMIKDSDEVKRLSATITQGIDYNAIKDKPTLSQYKAFRSKYPDSIYLQNLRKKLPPEKYWDKALKLNEKGYYEITFGMEHNEHRMIYIPEKKIWIDKYEVSWAQFKKMLKIQNIDFQFQHKEKCEGDEDSCPAVVKYESAEKYCEIYKLRLPTEKEWEYAANGGKKIDYPWGNESPNGPGLYRANFTSMEDGFTFIAPVKSYEDPRATSQTGLVNMSGNVWEWVDGRICKGGGFLSEEVYLQISNKSNSKNEAGFRCIYKEVEK